jgi:hypothetical protein
MPFLIFAINPCDSDKCSDLPLQEAALKNLSADVTFSTPVASCGDTITITETIINQKALPLPWITLKFEASRELLFLDMTNTKVSDHYYREDLMSLSGWQQHNRTFSSFAEGAATSALKGSVSPPEIFFCCP